MASFAEGVGALLRQEVIDETNLTGHYDMEFVWTAPQDPGAAPPDNRLGPAGVALFMTMMKDQFGLHFSGATGAVQYWVIDHIEPPSEN